MNGLVLDSKGHEEFPEAEVQATVKKRRTAVERAAESLEKAKAKARARLLKLAEAKLEEARRLLIGAEDVQVYLNNQHETCSSWETVETIRDAIRAELGE